jgi:hypothetical protein
LASLEKVVERVASLFPLGNRPTNNSKSKYPPPPHYVLPTNYNAHNGTRQQNSGPPNGRYEFRLKQGFVFSKRPETLIATLQAAGPQYQFELESAPDGTTKLKMRDAQLRDTLEIEASKLYYRAPGAKKFIVH